MNLESRARRLSSDWQYHSTRSYPESRIGTVYRLLTAAGDQGRDPTVLEVRLIATELDRLESLLGEQVDRLIDMIGQVAEFASAVNEALTDAEPAPAAPEWLPTQTGIDDAMVDRLAAFYTRHGNEIR